jgi:hypothetical protein
MTAELRFYVSAEFEAPPRDPHALVEAMAWHGAIGPTLEAGEAAFALDVSASQGDQGSAARRAFSVLIAAAHEAGAGTPAIRSLRTSVSPQRPPAPLVGVAEVAGILGVSRQRVCQLSRSDTLPRPIAELAAGPVWTSAQIERFRGAWDRRPGRRTS